MPQPRTSRLGLLELGGIGFASGVAIGVALAFYAEDISQDAWVAGSAAACTIAMPLLGRASVTLRAHLLRRQPTGHQAAISPSRATA